MSLNDSAGGGDPITTSTTDYQLPKHLRVGMTQCDPLLIFDGRFVLVPTCDGRIAIYSIFDLDVTANGNFSEDVEASERRKHLEWMEEDTVHSILHHQLQQTMGNSRADNMNASHHPQQLVEEEESEWDVRDRMRRHEDAKENVKPIRVISLPRTSSFVTSPLIVAMCATNREGENPSSTIDTTDEPFEVRMSVDRSHDESLIGHVVVLTSDGDVHTIEFRNPSQHSIDSQLSNEGRLVKHIIPTVTIVLSFSTNCLEATCICMSQDLVHETVGESLQSQSIQVCIGHESGILKAYHIYPLYSQELPTSPTSPLKVEGHKRSPTAGDRIATEVIDAIPLQRTRSAPITSSESVVTHTSGPPRAELYWMGTFDVPIRSLSSFGSRCQNNETAGQSLLVVGLERRENAFHQVSMNGIGPPVQNHALSPAISLEVVNIARADELWSHMNNATETKVNDTHCIRLHDCSVWPTPGKEIKDGWMRGSSPRGIDPRDKLFVSLGLQRTSVTNKICSFEGPDPCFVSAANDGTVVVAQHAHQGDGSWGVMDEDNQIMLFQQCIGLGTLDFYRTRRYIVCCLRAGTIIITPEAMIKTNNQIKTTTKGDNLIMFPVSMASNGDDDGFIHLVQSFTAGTSRVTTWNASLGKVENEGCLMKPIAIVGWPGGILDVYEIQP
jgi:hypothetical protein